MPRPQSFVPPPPSPEIPVSPPVIPNAATSSASPPNWARPDHPQHGLEGFPIGAYGHPAFSAPGLVAPGSYFIPPTALPSTAPIPTAPVSGNGYSVNYTGFPDMGHNPHVHPGSVLPPMAASSGPAAATATPWSRPGMFGVPGITVQAPPGTQFNAFQQPLPYAYPGAWTPGVHPAAAFTPYAAFAVPPWATPAAATPFTPAGLPPGFQAMPPPRAEPPRHERPFHDEMLSFKHDKFDEEVQYGPVLEPFLIKRLNSKLELNPLLLPPPEDNASRPWLSWDMRFHTGQCQRSPSKGGNRSWSDGRNSPATWPRVKSLRLVSKFFPWMIEVAASNPELGVTCADVLEGLHGCMYTRCPDTEYKRAPRDKRNVIYEAFNRNRSTEDGAPGGRMPQTLLRCDWLGDDNQWGGMVHDERLVNEICGVGLPCTFVVMCEKRYLGFTDTEVREQEARLSAADTARAKRARSQTRSSRATSRATSQAGDLPSLESFSL